MQVLLILLGSTLLFRLLGAAGVTRFGTWLVSARAGLAIMFLFTAASHFGPMKRELIAMVPPSLPRPDLLVLLTGIAEAVGALGLLVPEIRFWAACGLIVLLVAMLPANISAVRRNLTLRGRPATALVLRIPMQMLFVGWAWSVR
ncbi:MAG TPA: MauE/DoxX family redox-associated membrane protein [Vicinamibacterales bacterium]|nr:MauE/DoxX family redox-associated membrane protein [Vicinamibacterales bacterium]